MDPHSLRSCLLGGVLHQSGSKHAAIHPQILPDGFAGQDFVPQEFVEVGLRIVRNPFNIANNLHQPYEFKSMTARPAQLAYNGIF